MKCLDGRSLSSAIKNQLKQKVLDLKKTHEITPGLAVLLVGENPASQVYVEQKLKACKEVGFCSWKYTFPTNTQVEVLKKQIHQLNAQPEVHGILVQLPLPPSLNETEVLSWIDSRKDPDGLVMENKGRLWSFKPHMIPCTPRGILVLLKHYKIPLESQNVVIVGRSQIVGLPLIQQFLEHNSTVTVCHSFTQNLSEITKRANIVVVCAGKKGLLGKEDFKQGATVVDVGIHREKEGNRWRLKGDVRKEGLEDWLSALSPVPGGVGPMTIAMLLENTFQLAKPK